MVSCGKVNIVRRSFKFRLLPTITQERQFEETLAICCELYNACLQERRDAYRIASKSVSLSHQQAQLPTVKFDRPEIKNVYAQVLQDVCLRVDRAFTVFFRRVKTSQKKAGYPRYRSHRRYDSFTYPQVYVSGKKSRVKFQRSRFLLPKIGWVRWTPWKPLEDLGCIKTATVKREADGWYAILSCEIPVALLSSTGKAVGIDLGLHNLVTTSDGEVLGDLRPLKVAENRLRKAQRRVSRHTCGSNRRQKAIQILSRHHQNLARARKAQLDIITKKIIEKNDIICIEDLNVAGLSRTGVSNAQGRGFRRNIHHASWSMLRRMLTYKAESAGRQVIAVPPAGTSQECSVCETVVFKRLSERTHRCGCGLVIDRDVNAARNILKRGLRLLRRGDGAVRPLQRPEKIGKIAIAV